MILSLPWGDRRPRFVDPIPGIGRTAVFEPFFRRSANLLPVDPAAPDAASRIREFGPAAIAGRFDTVLKFANETKPTHALIVFTNEGERCLSEADRDELWEACGLPVFEQVITSEGRLVAWECEAHEGLHLAEGARLPITGKVEAGLCGCGGAAARVIAASIAPAFGGERGARIPLLPAPIGSRTRPLPT